MTTRMKFNYNGRTYNNDQELLRKVKEEIPIETITQYIADHPDYGASVLDSIAEFDPDLYDEIIAGVVENWVAGEIEVVVEP